MDRMCPSDQYIKNMSMNTEENNGVTSDVARISGVTALMFSGPPENHI